MPGLLVYPILFLMRGGIENVRTFDDLPPDQKARIQDLVRQVWEFFKETENPPHIPSFDKTKLSPNNNPDICNALN